MFGRTTGTTDLAGEGGGSTPLADALARLPMPNSPVRTPWDFSASGFLRPYLPRPFQRASKLLDRFGAVRLGPAAIGLDNDADAAWADVVEVRTRNLFDVLSDGFVEDLRRRCTDLAPPVPGMGPAARWAADKAAELALSRFLLALPDSPHERVPDVPAEIVHRDRKGRQRQMRPGLVAGAVLTLPAVRASVLATARAHGVAVVASGPSVITEAAGARAAALEHRRGLLSAQIARLRRETASAADPPADPSADSSTTTPATEREGKGRTMGLFSRNKSASASRPAPARPSLGQGRLLWSALDVDGCIKTLGAAMLRLREPQYKDIPPVFVPGWTWLGDDATRPDAAVVCFNDKRDFLLVALRRDASGTVITMIPLKLGDEQSTVGMWKQLDSSLSSRGRTPDGLVTLDPPPVADDILHGMLADTGHPVTPHNIDVLASMMTRQFGMKAYQFISNSDEAAARRFVDRHPYLPGTGVSVARQVLADLADWNPQVLPYIQDLPMRVRAIMLEARAAEGTFWSDLHR